jgi:hypothetical protein
VQDAQLRTEQLVYQWFHKTDSLVASGLVYNVARVLFIHNSAQPIPDEARLHLLLKKLKITKEQKAPIGVFTHAGGVGDEPAYLGLSMRVPDIPPANMGALENLALLIKFACAVTGADQQKVRIVTDPTLGNTCLLPAFQQKLLNEISMAAQHSQGICTASVYKIKEGFNANPVEMLGLLKVLLSYKHLCRRTTVRKGRDVKHLEPSEIREAYNLHCGLKATQGSWVLQFITEALSYAVRPTTNSFPGSFIHAAKVRFGAKSSLALLHTMGWEPLVPTHVKANTVVYNRVNTDTRKIVRMSDEDELDFVEHRTMVALCLPKINPNSSQPFDDQLRRDPLSNYERGTLKAFSRKEYVSLIDALVLAFNIFNSVSDPRSKATWEHFKNVRNEVLKRSAFIPLIDASGKEYRKFSELPESLRAYFNKHYHFKVVMRKRARSRSPVFAGDQPMIPIEKEGEEENLPQLPQESGVTPPPEKKMRVDVSVEPSSLDQTSRDPVTDVMVHGTGPTRGRSAKPGPRGRASSVRGGRT